MPDQEFYEISGAWTHSVAALAESASAWMAALNALASAADRRIAGAATWRASDPLVSDADADPVTEATLPTMIKHVAFTSDEGSRDGAEVAIGGFDVFEAWLTTSAESTVLHVVVVDFRAPLASGATTRTIELRGAIDFDEARSLVSALRETTNADVVRAIRPHVRETLEGASRLRGDKNGDHVDIVGELTWVRGLEPQDAEPIAESSEPLGLGALAWTPKIEGMLALQTLLRNERLPSGSGPTLA